MAAGWQSAGLGWRSSKTTSGPMEVWKCRLRSGPISMPSRLPRMGPCGELRFKIVFNMRFPATALLIITQVVAAADLTLEAGVGKSDITPSTFGPMYGYEIGRSTRLNSSHLGI